MASPPPGLWVAIALGACGLAGTVALWLFCWICPAWRYREWRDARSSRMRVRRLSTELSQSQYVQHCATIATEAAPSFHSRVRALSQLYTRRSSGRLLRDASARGRAASAPQPAPAAAAALAVASGPSLADHHDDAGDVSLEEVARAALALELSGARSPPRIGAGNVPVLQMPPTAPSPDSRWQRSSPRSAGRRSGTAIVMGMPRTPDPSNAGASPGTAAAAATSRSWRDKLFPSGNAPSRLSRSVSSPAHWQTGPSAPAAAASARSPLSPAALVRSGSAPRAAASAAAPAAELEMSPLAALSSLSARRGLAGAANLESSSGAAERGGARSSRPARAEGVAVDIASAPQQQLPAHVHLPFGAAMDTQSSSAPALPQAVGSAEASAVAPVSLQPAPLQRIRQPGILIRIVEPDLPHGGSGSRAASDSPQLGLNRATSQQRLLGAAGTSRASADTAPSGREYEAQAAAGEGLSSVAASDTAVTVTPNTALAALEELETAASAHAGSGGAGRDQSRQPGQRAESSADFDAATAVPAAEASMAGPAAAAAPPARQGSAGRPAQSHYRSFTTGSMMALAPRSASGSAPVVAVRVAAEQERRLSPRNADAAATRQQRQQQPQLRSPLNEETAEP